MQSASSGRQLTSSRTCFRVSQAFLTPRCLRKQKMSDASIPSFSLASCDGAGRGHLQQGPRKPRRTTSNSRRCSGTF